MTVTTQTRPPAMARADDAPARWRPRRGVPILISRVLLLAAGLAFLHVVFAGTRWVTWLVGLFSMFVFPIDAVGLGSVVLFLVMAVSLQRRKRAAWWLAMIVFGLMWLSSVAVFVVLVVEVLKRWQPDPPTDVSLSASVFNVFSVGVILALLLLHRRDFAARTARGNLGKAVLTLVVGLAISAAVGVLIATSFGDSAHRRSRTVDLLRHLILGSDAPSAPGVPHWGQTLLGVLVAASMLIALMVLLRSQQAAATLQLPDELQLRTLLAEREPDSLGYFATRRDKAIVFGPRQDAAIAYRAQLGVCLASGDPIGMRDNWPGAITAFLEHARRYGLSPAVVGASEDGARAFTAAGLRALRVGDEAVLRPARFDLSSHELKGVATTVRRLERLGYEVLVRRHRDIPRAELERIIADTDAWRSTDEERGFSMALGRLGDVLDGDCLMVQALYPTDRVPVDFDRSPSSPGATSTTDRTAGVLSLVPWGRHGYSLDVMRRSPYADNGITELMVAGLMARARDFGIEKVSLNFAVFRAVLEEGNRVGATPVQRMQRRLLMVASRWFQIEQLYRSNVKYDPEWQPRFLCYEEPSDIVGVALALAVAEGYVSMPARLDPVPAQLPVDAHDPQVVAWLRQLDTAPEIAPERVPDQMQARLATRERLLGEGLEAYPASFHPDADCREVQASAPGRRMVVAGRVVALRDFGGVAFVGVQDWSGQAQMLVSADAIGAESLRSLVSTLSLGDHCGFGGLTGLSRNGTPSLLVDSWTLTAKSLRPLPDKRKGMSDPETRVRQRYLDLIVNPQARHRLAARSKAIGAVRQTLLDKGFLEVETPILQTIHGGANARPFRTHINAYDLDLYLRIAPELYLKRLMVGGVDKVFEIGRNFRNEGADATHNPEFTMLEAYEAYGDYVTMRVVAQDIITNAAKAALGSTVIRGTDAHGVEHQVDLAEPWKVITVNEAITAACGEQITAETTKEQLIALADRLEINVDPRWTRGNVLLELYEHLVEHVTVAPTFYCDFPAEVSPLTRQHRVDARLAERWDLVAFGAEIGTAYSELVDPVIQRDRLTAQSLQAAGGDPEAMELDEAFLTALEYAMPPSGGLGMGLDRLVMMLTEASIRETIAFPLVRPRT